jgi:hypothetical protein
MRAARLREERARHPRRRRSAQSHQPGYALPEGCGHVWPPHEREAPDPDALSSPALDTLGSQAARVGNGAHRAACETHARRDFRAHTDGTLVNHALGIASLGGATLDNEETTSSRSSSALDWAVYGSRIRRASDTAPRCPVWAPVMGGARRHSRNGTSPIPIASCARATTSRTRSLRRARLARVCTAPRELGRWHARGFHESPNWRRNAARRSRRSSACWPSGRTSGRREAQTH